MNATEIKPTFTINRKTNKVTATFGGRSVSRVFRPERGDTREDVKERLTECFKFTCWECWDSGQVHTYRYSYAVGDSFIESSRICPACK